MTGDRTCPCRGSWIQPSQWARVDQYAPAVWPLTVGTCVAPLTVGPFEPYDSAGQSTIPQPQPEPMVPLGLVEEIETTVRNYSKGLCKRDRELIIAAIRAAREGDGK